MSDIQALEQELLQAVGAASDRTHLEDLRISTLGKKGKLTQMMKELGRIEPEARKAQGQALNQVKQAFSKALSARQTHLELEARSVQLQAERIDISLPTRPESQGKSPSHHPSYGGARCDPR